MFGIVLANMDELIEDERDRYRETYCGICHSLKERYGQMSRICVNYDMVLLALLRESLFEHGESVSSSRCMAHPSRKHRFARGKEIDYAADMSVAFAYHKCIDDWNDDGNKAAKACSSALKRSYSRVKGAHSAACSVLERELCEIRSAEQMLAAGEVCEDALPDDAMAEADKLAKRFGSALAVVFSDGCSQWSGELAAFGAELGRFIYFMDAALDRDEDAQSGSFNPFNTCGISAADADALLSNVLGRAVNVFERLPLEQDLNLMRSILYAGVWQRLRSKQASVEKGGE
ncbi:MAG: hypothetical protein IJ087_07175 [Eggerthellaceae bacterium]|nr:hypothetical protein [Eggerthellaceae bacterium]